MYWNAQYKLHNIYTNDQTKIFLKFYSFAHLAAVLSTLNLYNFLLSASYPFL